MQQFVNNLKRQLQAPLPGVEAQYKMAPTNRRKADFESRETLRFKPSAVLVLLCQDTEGNPFIPLIERVDYNGVHSGQVSLPGGKYEEKDEELKNTAVRECEEEIGIANVSVIGSLTELFIPVSGFRVQPFVGVYNAPGPNFTKQEREVKRLLSMRIGTLLNDEIIKTGSVNLPGNLKMQVPYFELEDLKIWGATAMILNELKEIIKLKV